MKEAQWMPEKKQIRQRPDELGARRKAYLQEMAMLAYYAWGDYKIPGFDSPERPYNPDFQLLTRGKRNKVYGTPVIRELAHETVRWMAEYIGCTEEELKKR